MSDLTQFDQLKADVTLLVEPTMAITVTSNETKLQAVEAVKNVKDLVKKVEATRKSLVQPLNERVKQINAYASDVATPLQKAERHLKGVITEFEMAERRRIEEEKRRIEEQANREREEAQARARAEQEKIDAQHRADEAAAREAAELFGAEDPEVLAAEQKRQAEQAERDRLAREARLRREQDERNRSARKAAAELDATKVKGMRMVWKAEVVSASEIPREYLTVDMTAINAAIRAGVREIPGVRIYEDAVLAVGSTSRRPVLGELRG